jgi:hypothetical protein
MFRILVLTVLFCISFCILCCNCDSSDNSELRFHCNSALVPNFEPLSDN